MAQLVPRPTAAANRRLPASKLPSAGPSSHIKPEERSFDHHHALERPLWPRSGRVRGTAGAGSARHRRIVDRGLRDPMRCIDGLVVSKPSGVNERAEQIRPVLAPQSLSERPACEPRPRPASRSRFSIGPVATFALLGLRAGWRTSPAQLTGPEKKNGAHPPRNDRMRLRSSSSLHSLRVSPIAGSESSVGHGHTFVSGGHVSCGIVRYTCRVDVHASQKKNRWHCPRIECSGPGSRSRPC